MKETRFVGSCFIDETATVCSNSRNETLKTCMLIDRLIEVLEDIYYLKDILPVQNFLGHRNLGERFTRLI